MTVGLTQCSQWSSLTLYALTAQNQYVYFFILLCTAARGRRWIELTAEEHRAYVMRLLDALEVTDRDKRLKVARAILYLAQGGSFWPFADRHVHVFDTSER